MSNSDSDEESHIRYGTPLDPYEEDEVPWKRKYQQPADQYAVDEHGRRRFHGAFTGGFSAGYGNSVGTPEGWTPASFKSSRGDKNKATFSGQRPEDFMDDEDRNEFGIAPRHLQTKAEFSGRKRNVQQRYHDGPIPGEPVLEQILRPVHETIAVKLLRAMGWRDGRGAGGAVTKSQRRRARQQHKVYGCFIPEDLRQPTEPQSESSSDSEVDFDALYQPEDYEPYILRRKNDQFGLGYKGLSRHSVLGEMRGEYGAGEGKSHLMMRDKGKKVSIRGQAFGVGAFEDEDQDIYAAEDMSHYDFELGGENKMNKVQKKQERGVNVLEGFVKASKPIPVVQNYPPPALPRDFVPKPAGFRKTRFDSTTVQERDQGLGRHELTAQARGALLGEIPIPKQNEPEDIVAKITGRNINFTSENEPSTSQNNNQNENATPDFIPIADSGKELVKVFKPFKSDPKKQQRYESYLNDKSSVMKRDGDMDNLSEWERNREMAEFEQASKLYKPLSGFIADRFTHASEPDDALNPLTVVAKSSVNYGLATPEMVEAANKGVYGVMTRKVDTWVPEALVYKRFNVPQPGIMTENKKAEKPKVSYSIFSYLESSVHDKESFAKEQTKFSGSKSLNKEKVRESMEIVNAHVVDKIENNPKPEEPSTSSSTGFAKRLTVAELFMRESEKDIQNKNTEITDTIEKFDKMDLYKSIFLSDTEDEDGTESNEKEINQNINTDSVNEFIEAPKNVERNTSPPRGIFANIDFEELNSWRRKAEEKKDQLIDQPVEKEDGGTSSRNLESANIDDANMYGPKIPESLQKGLANPEPCNFKPVYTKRDPVIDVNSSSSSDSWVTESELKQAKKHKKKKSKKHKSKHKKSKHKKKSK